MKLGMFPVNAFAQKAFTGNLGKIISAGLDFRGLNL